jgi:glycine cleavage system H protein
MNFPQDLTYTATHEWIRFDGNTASVGITDYAQSELGDIIFIELPSVGHAVKAGEPFGSIEAVKTVSDMYAPLTGEISAVNEKLKDAPEIINSDCYGEGWIVRIRVSDPSAREGLLTAAQYQVSIGH